MRKKRPTLISASGAEVIMPFRTSYWFDARMKEPSRTSRGFPISEDGSIVGLHWIHRGIAAKIQCTDRVKEKVIWTVKRGPRIPGTHLYEAIIQPGDID